MIRVGKTVIFRHSVQFLANTKKKDNNNNKKKKIGLQIAETQFIVPLTQLKITSRTNDKIISERIGVVL